MDAKLNQIKNIVIVMMENRSFDHMLGYLSLPPFNRTEIDGQSVDQKWLEQFTNKDGANSYQPYLDKNPYTLPDKFDPPHERTNVAQNLGLLVNGSYRMDGFVTNTRNIPAPVSSDPNAQQRVMGYFGAEQVPISNFFAQNFAICDRWFAAISDGTHPNRLMSLSGYTRIDANVRILPEQDTVYDWLTRHGISWRVYHQCIPFCTLMPKWVPDILLNNHFKDFKDFAEDIGDNPPEDLPQVIFVEPTYTDGPYFGFSTDDHAPSGVSNGQEFLMKVYNAITSSPTFWKTALMIVDYDEHGGFFDHVSPPMIVTQPPPGAKYSTAFASLGVRTPGYLISPFVKKSSVHHNTFDHTSVLKLLAERFDPKESYSNIVDARPVESLSAVLNFNNPILDSPSAPALDSYLSSRPAPPTEVQITTPYTPQKQGFHDAIERMKQNGADSSHEKFGELIAAVEKHPNYSPST